MAKSKKVAEQEEVVSAPQEESNGELITADQVKAEFEKETPVGHSSRDFGKK